jgi:hypothetical protein
VKNEKETDTKRHTQLQEREREIEQEKSRGLITISQMTKTIKLQSLLNRSIPKINQSRLITIPSHPQNMGPSFGRSPRGISK